MIEKLEGRRYKRDFPELGLKDQPQYEAPKTGDIIDKLNTVIDSLNSEIKKREREEIAIRFLSRALEAGAWQGSIENINQILTEEEGE